jgi:peptidoglycan-N-acetylglucosamine deacetylase
MTAASLSNAQPAQTQPATAAERPFPWPAGKKAAVSLSFDDARLSQIDTGMALFARYGVQATWYVSLPNVEKRLSGWREAVAAGHEIGNHTLTHPCTGNFPWSRENALEAYTLERMRFELVKSNYRLAGLLGVTCRTFAYPCGQTFVGRGRDTASYIPLVAELFTAGRGWLAECVNEPHFCDLSHLMGTSSDGSEFEQLQPLLATAQEKGQWVVLAGHEIGAPGHLTTRVSTLERLLQYAQAPENGFWLAPVISVADYILKQREENGKTFQETAS